MMEWTLPDEEDVLNFQIYLLLFWKNPQYSLIGSGVKLKKKFFFIIVIF